MSRLSGGSQSLRSVKISVRQKIFVGSEASKDLERMFCRTAVRIFLFVQLLGLFQATGTAKVEKGKAR